MARISAVISITLDGVTQSPGRADEDTRDGFTAGGWANRFADDVAMQESGRGMGSTGAILFGRRTYVDFAGFWPKAPKPNPFTDFLDATQKYVASNSLEAEQEWENTTVVSGDTLSRIAALKKELDSDIVVLGSIQLVQAMLAARLIDTLSLSIHPIVLGHGRRLFDAGLQAEFTLERSVATTTGVIIATYERS